jgi:hypothetical protein
MATECELLSTCIFFADRMGHMPVTASIMKQQYCRGNFERCARYQVFKTLGRGAVPPDLLPNAERRCDRILDRH